MTEPERRLIALKDVPPDPPEHVLRWDTIQHALRRRRAWRNSLTVLTAAAATTAVVIAVSVATAPDKTEPAPTGPPGVNGEVIVARFEPTPANQLINTDLVAVAPNGSSAPRQLTNDGGADDGAAVSPDGRTVAYVHETSIPAGPSSFRIHAVLRLVDIDGANDRQVHICKSFCQDLAWSPNSQTLAFADDGIRVLTLAGGEVSLVCGASCGAGLAEPVWSPDGRRIAFSQRGLLDRIGIYIPPSAIFVVDADGTKLTQLTGRQCHGSGDDCTIDTGPTWSPDGNAIAFVRYPRRQAVSGGAETPTDSSARVFTMQPSGAELRALWRCPTNPCQTIAPPQWSPDGSAIAVLGDDRGANAFIINSSTGRAATVSAPVDGARRLWTAIAWSPDGTRLALLLERGGEAGSLYIVDSEGRDMSEVSLSRVYGAGPVLWAPVARE